MNRFYLPEIANGSGPTPPVQGAGETSYQRQLFALMCDDPGQRRNPCAWYRPVALVAQARCEAMGRYGWFEHHLDQRGHGPNWWIRQAGISLPDGYGQSNDSNNVESLGLNYQTPQECWQGWLDSPTHRAHVLTFAEQTLVGVGFWQGFDKWPNYWCVISVPDMRKT